MIGSYSVTMGQHSVGVVSVSKEGLYYRIICRCKLPEDKLCRLAAQWEDREAVLGVLIPEGGSFCLNKRLPIKQAGLGVPQFIIPTSLEQNDQMWVPVYEDAPFTHLTDLNDARFQVVENQAGILIPQAEGLSQPDNGQNP